MNLTQEIINLAKILHDAHMQDCWITKEQIKKECDKFPIDLKPHTYTVQQPWIDIAIAQAKAVFKTYKLQQK